MSNNRLANKVLQEYPEAEVLSLVRVVHHEWDLDGWVALVKHGRQTFVFTTDHGSLVKMSLTEGRKFMRDQIRETQAMVDAMKDFQGTLRTALGD